MSTLHCFISDDEPIARNILVELTGLNDRVLLTGNYAMVADVQCDLTAKKT